MVDTASSRVARGLGSADLSPADIVAKTRGNPQEIMKLVMSGQINLTQGFLAKQLADGVVAEQQKAMQPQTTVLQDQFPEMAQAMGAPAPAPQMPPMPQAMGAQMGAMQMQPTPATPATPAEGGLGQLDFAMPEYAGGGMVGYADGEEVTYESLLDIAPNRSIMDYFAGTEAITNFLPQSTEAAEAYRARLQESDPERERKRAELAGLFGSLANVRPGMNPLEALAQGFSTTGGAMLAGEERAREQELARLEGLMNLENAQNQRAREIFNVRMQLAEAERTGASEADKRKLEIRLAQLQRAERVADIEREQAFEARQNALERGSRLEAARISAASSGGRGGVDGVYLRGQVEGAQENLLDMLNPDPEDFNKPFQMGTDATADSLIPAVTEMRRNMEYIAAGTQGLGVPSSVTGPRNKQEFVRIVERQNGGELTPNQRRAATRAWDTVFMPRDSIVDAYGVTVPRAIAERAARQRGQPSQNPPASVSRADPLGIR